MEWDHPELLKSTIAVVQSISTIRKGKRTRVVKKEDSRGARLKLLEQSIANLDNTQSRAVIETVEGVQRIRGLAGSGKTIILALKAAYLHSQHPDWKIAVTFNTRSLKAQFRRLINTFVIEQSGEEPDWGKLLVLNAWGAPGTGDRTGIYYEFVKSHGLEYTDFQSAKNRYGFDEAFSGVCREAIKSATSERHVFDAMLIDEAQDFDPSFFRMCYSMLSKEKRLVYAYDELQSLTESSLPPPEELFGKSNSGKPNVQFAEPQPGQPQQDIILEKCYRNSRPVLSTAHALGFGIYREPDPKTGTGLIQLFDNSKLWNDVGYVVESGELEEDQRVVLRRTSDTSPLFLENHSPLEDLIEFKKFDSKEEQASWIANQIQENLTNDELQPDDIIIINPNPLTTRKEVGKVRQILFERNIDSHLAGVDVSAETFFDEDNQSITFTGIFRAKGNEAGMVYIMNADDCAKSFGNLARVRNQLFTAITRSKAWVRVLGVGKNMQVLMDEFERVRNAEFKLEFQYPSEAVRRKLNLVNRDMTDAEKRATKTSESNLRKLLDDLDSGSVQLEDLSPEIISKLRGILTRDPSDG
nr:ATP-binding domain-containing protein [uncultured Hyphomonas sp.]